MFAERIIDERCLQEPGVLIVTLFLPVVRLILISTQEGESLHFVRTEDEGTLRSYQLFQKG